MENSLMRALVIGLVLAVAGIGMFFFMYNVVLAGAVPVVRLMVSLVSPPIVMAILVGGYYILTQDEDKSGE